MDRFSELPAHQPGAWGDITMKLTPTLVVEIGALVAVSGVLLLTTVQLSATEIAFLRALSAIILGLFFMQIGYAQSLRERTLGELDKRRLPPDGRE
jgi:hypothetical protein